MERRKARFSAEVTYYQNWVQPFAGMARGFRPADEEAICRLLQTCGLRKWLAELEGIHEALASSEHEISAAVVSAFCDAAARCLSGLRLPRRARTSKCAEVLDRARGLWQAWADTWGGGAACFDVALAAGLRLCDIVRTPAALVWAEEIWDQARAQAVPRTVPLYNAMLCILEWHNRYDAVDKILLQDMLEDRLSPNAEVLEELVGRAAARQDWERTDLLWNFLVCSHHVQPTAACYAAHAEAHLLAGRPSNAASILEDMFDAGVGPLTPTIAASYLQILLVICHSDPTPSNMTRLKEALKQAEGLTATGLAAKELTKLKQVAGKLMLDPCALPFRQVLVSRKARQSEMKGWRSPRAGSCYARR
ncbi:unnamed protein product [Symbiodinium natans]|uniref:Pentatricopeptide repeat-containing protein, chloroplastic n=1 Tax=Symbiodinium natans TaxID=878477 RepID=A0A812PZZ1_9DINO|nr:unnamed protein product [Symbiodinium natans]